MKEFIFKIIPIIIFFALGYFFKQIKLFKKEDGSILLSLVFYLCMPALAFSSLLETQFSSQLILIPFLPVIVIAFTYAISRIVLYFKPLERKSRGTFLIATMIMNTGFTLPFFYAAFGKDGFTKAILFDIGNSFIIFTWIYYTAVQAGSQEGFSKLKVLKKTLLLPPLWALTLAVLIKKFGLVVPTPAVSFFKMAGEPVIPLIMIALGLYFEPSLKSLKVASTAITIRMLGGLLMGLLLTKLIHFDAVAKIVIIASAAAPVGYNTLVFSNKENLDVELSATSVSFAILIGIFGIPLLFYFLG
ncbi:MAG TPA: AEC family transporter [Candidatus Cloacimonadota bacterium]|mgnify:CR=1 FL=1|jgi:predicted permease|nr:AEC family transporter [Candidatus Cloacimonadales bacterium]HPK40217.1 AEC family transporter [Candidatus Cloacimonadota bacterium]HPY96618.1 AEC family transporter [Candidatus Cloacimonadota bacterium]HQB40955.1 AEC family transporter [Candidatus Cloacimonadota bacterium]